MSNLPAWVIGADECELRIALTIAWDALRNIDENYDCGCIAKEALLKILEIGNE